MLNYLFTITLVQNLSNVWKYMKNKNKLIFSKNVLELIKGQLH